MYCTPAEYVWKVSKCFNLEKEEKKCLIIKFELDYIYNLTLLQNKVRLICHVLKNLPLISVDFKYFSNEKKITRTQGETECPQLMNTIFKMLWSTSVQTSKVKV